MVDHSFFLENFRFHLSSGAFVLVLRGWFPKDNPDERSIEVYLDRELLNYTSEKKCGVEIRQKYQDYQADISEEIRLEVSLPQNWKEHKQLRIVSVLGQEKKTVRTVPVKQLIEMAAGVDHYIETEHVADGKATISGWAIGRAPVEILVTSAGEEIQSEITRYHRRDVIDIYEEIEPHYEAGFKITIPIGTARDFTLKLISGTNESSYHNSFSHIMNGKKWDSNISPNMFQKAVAYYRRNGIRKTWQRIQVKLGHKPEQDYNLWRQQHLTSEAELSEQRQMKFDYAPLFSIVIPVYQTPAKYLQAMIDSIIAQTYTNWELCLADGGGKDSTVTPILEKYAKADSRIRFETLASNEGISENTNAALLMAQGEYVIFADHDDLIPAEALYEFAKALNEDQTIDMMYSDEDKVDMDGKSYFEPNFKPDFNLDLLRSMNYICHLCAVKHELLVQAGFLRREYDGAQDYDLTLRCAEQARNIYHIPKVLYHWRCHLDSTASNPESKLYAFDAAKQALNEHYKRLGIPATVEHSTYYGMYHTCYHWTEEPLVSILIPNKDHIADLKKCITSIQEQSSYRNLEFIIIENNSTEETTFAAYQELERDFDNIRVVYYKEEFNYSKINNYGAKFAKGEYLLLLNNDTEMIGSDAIREMLNYCMREDVGIVGAKLMYEDDTIQHAGVVIGFSGMAGHAFIGSSRYDLGYQARIFVAQDYSAVTAACLMTKKKVFETVGGLSEELVVAFNDIDYCMKVRKLGKLVVYNPYAEFYHYESKSRGLEDTPEKVIRFNQEVGIFQQNWGDVIQRGDPYYNPNLTLNKADFSLK